MAGNPNMRRWSAEKLDKEFAFANACRLDGDAEREWAEKIDAEIARRKAQPVAVVHEPTQKIEARFDTVGEAEAYIADTLHVLEPEAVERGDYGINAPEEMVNPPLKRRT